MLMPKWWDRGRNQLKSVYYRTWYNGTQSGSVEVCLDLTLASLKFVIVKLIMKNMDPQFADTTQFSIKRDQIIF